MTWKHPRQGAAGHAWYEMEGTIYEHHWIVLVQWGQLTCETHAHPWWATLAELVGYATGRTQTIAGIDHLLIQPLLLITKRVCAVVPSQRLAYGNCFRGYIIIGGNTKPDAEAHDNTSMSFPLLTRCNGIYIPASQLSHYFTRFIYHTPQSHHSYIPALALISDLIFHISHQGFRKNPLWSPCVHSEHENMREVEGHVLLI